MLSILRIVFVYICILFLVIKKFPNCLNGINVLNDNVIYRIFHAYILYYGKFIFQRIL